MSEPSRSTTVAVGKAKPAVARYFDCDEIAVDRACRGVRRDREFAAELLLVDRHQPAAAAGKAAENPERAVLGAVDQLDDVPAGFLVARLVDADQRAVADAGDFARAGAAWRGDVDDRRRAMRLLRPIRSAAPKIRRRCRGR